jgi:hypothetical protein
METLTLVQTGKRAPLPLILLDSPGGTYWLSWVDFLKKELLVRQYISGTDFDFFELVDSADAAVEKIGRFYHRYHSMRYVDDQLVMRLTSEIPQEEAAELKRRFSDILKPQGDLRLSKPLPEEADEPEIAHLPRLVVDFNRQDLGRLRKLIDAINGVKP